MELSVVILNYNVRYFLEGCLQSVRAAITGMDAEIIVVDNSSCDGSCDMVRARFPEVVLIENKENLGFSRANNRAVQLAKGEFVCILNPDTLVGGDCFGKFLAFAKAKKNLGAAGPRLIDGTGCFLPESKRNLPTPGVALKKLIGDGKSYYAGHIPETATAEVQVLVGAFLFLRRGTYLEMGGFDERYFMYGEDIDFSYRLSQKGYANYYLGTETVIHFKGESTIRDGNYLKRFYGAMELFYNTHFARNLLQRKVMAAAVFFAKKRAALQASQPQGTTVAPSAYYLISENEELREALQEKLIKFVIRLNEKTFNVLKPLKAYIIFDMNHLSYGGMIDTMQELKNRGNTNRIRPSNCNFIFGSDDSVSKGEAIVLRPNEK